MSNKILESDEVDSKYFRQAFGRILSMQLETQHKLDGIVSFLHERFFTPEEDSPRQRTFNEEESGDFPSDDEGDEL